MLNPHVDLYPAYLRTYLKRTEDFTGSRVAVQGGGPVKVALIGFFDRELCAEKGYHCVVAVSAEGVTIGEAATRAAIAAREILSDARPGRVAWDYYR